MDEKKKKILLGAEELFVKRGLKVLSMDEISRELHISKKTVYQHFDNKADLIRSIHLFSAERLKAEFEEIASRENLNAIDITFVMCSKVSEMLSSINSAYLFELKKYYPVLCAEFWAMRSDLMVKLGQENIRRGVEQGLYRADVCASLLSKIYAFSISSLYSDENLCSLFGEMSLGDVYTAVCEHHVRGLLTIKGMEYFDTLKRSSLSEPIQNN